jgi:ATP-dependent exoDNAse (exonuclease V) beta subunit
VLTGHPQASAELDLTLPGSGQQRLVIDRTFVEGDCRWVIDYKSSKPAAGVSLDAFVAEECLRYRDQLLRYRDALRDFDALQGAARPTAIRCGLYFVRIDHFAEIDLSP